MKTTKKLLVVLVVIITILFTGEVISYNNAYSQMYDTIEGQVPENTAYILNRNWQVNGNFSSKEINTIKGIEGVKSVDPINISNIYYGTDFTVDNHNFEVNVNSVTTKGNVYYDFEYIAGHEMSSNDELVVSEDLVNLAGLTADEVIGKYLEVGELELEVVGVYKQPDNLPFPHNQLSDTTYGTDYYNIINSAYTLYDGDPTMNGVEVELEPGTTLTVGDINNALGSSVTLVTDEGIYDYDLLTSNTNGSSNFNTVFQKRGGLGVNIIILIIFLLTVYVVIRKSNLKE